VDNAAKFADKDPVAIRITAESDGRERFSSQSESASPA
jgi:hypothetical protein